MVFSADQELVLSDESDELTARMRLLDGELVHARARMAALLLQDRFDAEAARAALFDLEEHFRVALERSVRALSRIHRVLGREQREQLSELIDGPADRTAWA